MILCKGRLKAENRISAPFMSVAPSRLSSLSSLARYHKPRTPGVGELDPYSASFPPSPHVFVFIALSVFLSMDVGVALRGKV